MGRSSIRLTINRALLFSFLLFFFSSLLFFFSSLPPSFPLPSFFFSLSSFFFPPLLFPSLPYLLFAPGAPQKIAPDFSPRLSPLQKSRQKIAQNIRVSLGRGYQIVAGEYAQL